LIEDDHLTLEAFEAALRRGGFEADAVGDAFGALELIGSQRYQVIVADHHLPVIKGAELLRALRGAVPQTALIIYSGLLTTEVIAEARSLGASAVLEKPFDLALLVETVREAVIGSR
jgi:DNA-binding response OmpR family regulator